MPQSPPCHACVVVISRGHHQLECKSDWRASCRKTRPARCRTSLVTPCCVALQPTSSHFLAMTVCAHPSRATLPRCALLSPTRVSSVNNSPLAVFPYTSRWRIPMMLTPLLSPTTSSRHVGIECTPQVRCDARNGRARRLCIPSHDPTARPRWQVTRMPLTLMARMHALSPMTHAAHPHVAHSHLSR